MPDRPVRRIPGRLITSKMTGQQANGNIRKIIREMATKREANIGVIYANLTLILAEVERNDTAWEQLEFEIRDDIQAENGKARR